MRARALTDREAVGQVVRLIQAAEVVAFRYADADLEDVDVDALLGVCRTTCIPVPGLAEHSQPIPNEDGTWTLYVNADDAPDVQMHCKLEHCGRYWPGSSLPRDRSVASAFALCGRLNRALCAAVDADARVAQVARLLRSADGLFAHREFNAVVKLADSALAKLERAASRTTNPAAAEAQFGAARALRIAQSYIDAEAGYRAAFRLADRGGLAGLATRSLMGAGECLGLRGNFPRADQLYRRAVRYAEANECHLERAWALHDWFLLNTEYGRFGRAERLAGDAEAAYPGRVRPVRLAHDVGWFYLLQGDYQSALDLITAALPHAETTDQKILSWGNIARAAGGLGLAGLFEEAYSEINTLALEPDAGGALVDTVLNLSYGAAMLGQYDRAEAAARKATELAAKAQRHRVAFEAEAQLGAVRDRSAAVRVGPREADGRSAIVASLCARLEV